MGWWHHGTRRLRTSDSVVPKTPATGGFITVLYSVHGLVA